MTDNDFDIIIQRLLKQRDFNISIRENNLANALKYVVRATGENGEYHLRNFLEWFETPGYPDVLAGIHPKGIPQ